MSAYCTQDDMDLQWGSKNVRKWADLENTREAAGVQARVAWAIENASAQIDDRMRHGPYAFPLELGSGEEYPAALVRMTALLAGCMLYESRGITDAASEQEHSLRWAEKKVDKWCRDVHARIVKLDLDLQTGEFPFVAEEDDEAEAPETFTS